MNDRTLHSLLNARNRTLTDLRAHHPALAVEIDVLYHEEELRHVRSVFQEAPEGARAPELTPVGGSLQL